MKMAAGRHGSTCTAVDIVQEVDNNGMNSAEYESIRIQS